jgi:hypothetical protein
MKQAFFVGALLSLSRLFHFSQYSIANEKNMTATISGSQYIFPPGPDRGLRDLGHAHRIESLDSD